MGPAALKLGNRQFLGPSGKPVRSFLHYLRQTLMSPRIGSVLGLSINKLLEPRLLAVACIMMNVKVSC